MNIEQLTDIIARHDPLLADAVGKMVGYIQDRWAAPYPSKEQTEAVNAYLRSVHADGDGTMSESNIAHRRIATQKITINAIRVLDHDQLNRLQNVLNHIAADREYYMPEQRQGMGRWPTIVTPKYHRLWIKTNRRYTTAPSFRTSNGILFWRADFPSRGKDACTG